MKRLLFTASILILTASCAQTAGVCEYQVGEIVQTKLHGYRGIVERTYGDPCIYLVRFNFADAYPYNGTQIAPVDF